MFLKCCVKYVNEDLHDLSPFTQIDFMLHILSVFVCAVEDSNPCLWHCTNRSHSPALLSVQHLDLLFLPSEHRSECPQEYLQRQGSRYKIHPIKERKYFKGQIKLQCHRLHNEGEIFHLANKHRFYLFTSATVCSWFPLCKNHRHDV